MALVMSDFGLKSLLQSITAFVSGVGGPLYQSKMGLFTNVNLNLSVGTVYGDLTQPSFSGYTRQSVTFASPVRVGDNSWATLTAAVKWQMTDSLTPTTASGMFICDGSNNLIYAEIFPSPLGLDSSNDAFYVIAEFDVGSGQLGSSTVVA